MRCCLLGAASGQLRRRSQVCLFSFADGRISIAFLRQFGRIAKPCDSAGCTEIAAGVVNSGGFE
jgi:hypothetical protein